VDQSGHDLFPNLTFFSDSEENLDVRISEDFEQAVLLNKTENYLLEKNPETEEEYQQTSLNWLKDKVMLSVSSVGSDFYIVSCGDYDDDLSIQSTAERNFKRKIKRRVEPNVLKVFDASFNLRIEPQIVDGERIRTVALQDLVLVMRRDDEFFYDVIIADEAPQAFYYTKTRGIYKKWPYLAMQGLAAEKLYLWVISIYEQNVINRIELPVNDDENSNEKNLNISNNYITESNDLFITCETDEGYNLYHLDCEQFDGRKDQIKGPKWRFYYTKEQAKEIYNNATGSNLLTPPPLLGLHVRSPNHREKIKVNKKLVVFFIHEGGIFQWIEST